MAASFEADSRALPPLWVISLMPALGLFTSSVHMPSIPAIAKEFGVTPGPIQQCVAAYLAAMAIFALVVGPMSDRLGRRPVGLLTLFIFFAGSITAMFSTSAPMLLVASLLQGVGASGGVVLSRSMVRDVLSGQAAAKASAQVAMVVAIAPMLAPIFGGYVQQVFGWRANFVIVVLVTLLLLLLSMLRLVETLPEHKRNMSSLGPMLKDYVGLLGLRRFQVHTVPIMCGTVGLFSYQTGGPVLLIGGMHVAPAAYGLYAAMPAFGFMIGTYITSRLALHVKEKTLIEAGCMLFVTSGALITALGIWTSPTPWAVALPMLLFGAGNGLVTPTATMGSLSAAPLLIGSAAALVGCLRMGAGSLGSFAITELPSKSATALGCVVSAAGFVAILSWRSLGMGRR